MERQGPRWLGLSVFFFTGTLYHKPLPAAVWMQVNLQIPCYWKTDTWLFPFKVGDKLGVETHTCIPTSQEDPEFEASLGYIVRLSLNQKDKQTENEWQIAQRLQV
jgi:hypothetical protein